MSAIPQTLEQVLRLSGYTIEVEHADEFTIALDTGDIVVPAMERATLAWQRGDDIPEAPGDDLWLGSIPLFADSYRPVLMSNILDRYRSRRLGYDTPDQFRQAVRRWGNLNMTVFNLRYISTGVALPLDDRNEHEIDAKVGTTGTTDATTSAATNHDLTIGSDFPQSQISGDNSFASGSTDARTAANASTEGTRDESRNETDTIARTGRSRSVMELLEQQRAVNLINVTAELLDAFDSLFLSVFDAGEGDEYWPRGSYFDTASLNWGRGW